VQPQLHGKPVRVRVELRPLHIIHHGLLLGEQAPQLLVIQRRHIIQASRPRPPIRPLIPQHGVLVGRQITRLQPLITQVKAPVEIQLRHGTLLGPQLGARRTIQLQRIQHILILVKVQPQPTQQVGLLFGAQATRLANQLRPRIVHVKTPVEIQLRLGLLVGPPHGAQAAQQVIQQRLRIVLVKVLPLLIQPRGLRHGGLVILLRDRPQLHTLQVSQLATRLVTQQQPDIVQVSLLQRVQPRLGLQVGLQVGAQAIQLVSPRPQSIVLASLQLQRILQLIQQRGVLAIQLANRPQPRTIQVSRLQRVQLRLGPRLGLPFGALATQLVDQLLRHLVRINRPQPRILLHGPHIGQPATLLSNRPQLYTLQVGQLIIQLTTQLQPDIVQVNRHHIVRLQRGLPVGLLPGAQATRPVSLQLQRLILVRPLLLHILRHIPQRGQLLILRVNQLIEILRLRILLIG
jgi:hypothetical protein